MTDETPKTEEAPKAHYSYEGKARISLSKLKEKLSADGATEVVSVSTLLPVLANWKIGEIDQQDLVFLDASDKKAYYSTGRLVPTNLANQIFEKTADGNTEDILANTVQVQELLDRAKAHKDKIFKQEILTNV